MGPLSKLWVMIKNANSGKDGSASVVQVDNSIRIARKNCNVLIG